MRETGAPELVLEIVGLREDILWSCVHLETTMRRKKLSLETLVEIDQLASRSRALSEAIAERDQALESAVMLARTLDDASRLIG